MTVNETNAFDLDDHSILRISGPDRHEFLQGQLTQDLDSLSPGQSVMAGWANAKGRLLLVSQFMTWNEAIYLPVRTDIAEPIARRLSMFVLRADVRVESPDLRLFGLSLGSFDATSINGLEIPPAAGACRANDSLCLARVIGDPGRIWGIADAETAGEIRDAAGTRLPAREWTRCDIRAGIPEIQMRTSELFVPQMLNLDLLGAISFTKGCYVGQEIVARTQNLGRIKRRMFRFRSESGGSFEPGETLYGPDNATGKILSISDEGDATEILGVIAIDSVESSWFGDEGHTLPLDLQPLPYSIPESG
jgi:folate-binding protein YgfZ